MNALEAAKLNAKYKAFYLSRYSPNRGKYITVGNPRATIQEALAAANRMDTRGDGKWMTFIDVVRVA